MKYSPWFSCRYQPPVRDGEYEFRLWFGPGEYGKPLRAIYSDGVWSPIDGSQWLFGGMVPGSVAKDQWRGVLRGKK